MIDNEVDKKRFFHKEPSGLHVESQRQLLQELPEQDSEQYDLLYKTKVRATGSYICHVLSGSVFAHLSNAGS